jgi:hypothetical protein
VELDRWMRCHGGIFADNVPGQWPRPNPAPRTS